MQTDDSSFLPRGTKLSGRYVIGPHLGSGGFGNTYVALDTKFGNGHRVAVKELFVRGVCGRDAASGAVSVSLSANAAQFGSLLRKFIKEAERMNGIDSPHVVRVTDVFKENGTAY